MRELEQLHGLFVAAVILAGGARRVGAPYPVFLALGGALLAFLPVAPSFTLPPELALALFVAPILLDAAYDASLRIAVAQTAPQRIPARIRIPTYAVWETVVFALNILAFIFIGLQIRPILESLEAADRGRYFAVRKGKPCLGFLKCSRCSARSERGRRRRPLLPTPPATRGRRQFVKSGEARGTRGSVWTAAPLLVFERRDGIDSRRAARRYVRGERRYQENRGR